MWLAGIDDPHVPEEELMDPKNQTANHQALEGDELAEATKKAVEAPEGAALDAERVVRRGGPMATRPNTPIAIAKSIRRET